MLLVQVSLDYQLIRLDRIPWKNHRIDQQQRQFDTDQTLDQFQDFFGSYDSAIKPASNIVDNVEPTSPAPDVEPASNQGLAVSSDDVKSSLAGVEPGSTPAVPSDDVKSSSSAGVEVEPGSTPAVPSDDKVVSDAKPSVIPPVETAGDSGSASNLDNTVEPDDNDDGDNDGDSDDEYSQSKFFKSKPLIDHEVALSIISSLRSKKIRESKRNRRVVSLKCKSAFPSLPFCRSYDLQFDHNNTIKRNGQ